MLRLTIPLLLLLWAPVDLLRADEPVRYVQSDAVTGASRAVVVRNLPWVQTSQILAWDQLNQIVSADDAGDQIQRILLNLNATLTAAGTGIDHIVKLNVYVTQDDLVPAVQRILAERFSGAMKPAVCYVTTALPQPQALVAMDALAVLRTDRPLDGVKSIASSAGQALPHAARGTLMPIGTRLYISGQANNAATLGAATRLTLEGLKNSLRYGGRSPPDIVQLKCFLTPMSRVAEVQREIETFFAPGPIPAVSYVEWESTLPIEIEVLAYGGAAPVVAPTVPIEYLAPPDLQPSPVFSRMARVRHPTTIFIGGLYGTSGATGTEQVTQIFADLGDLLQATGSDFKHLAKATYYVSEDEPSQQLNLLRPKFYHPQMPPAASKAQVKGVGKPGAGLTLDMIAVPAQNR